MWLTDKLANLVTGLGGRKDKSAATVFALQLLTRQELEAMYRSDWIARKIIDLIPYDETRAWRDWQAEDDHIEAIEEAERALKVRDKVARARKLARLYGGAAIIIGIGDAAPERPLDPERVSKGALQYLTVVSCHQINAIGLDRDPLSPFYGEPEKYEISNGKGTRVQIHPSRVVRFIGAELPDMEGFLQGWGDSVLQAVYDAVQNAASSQSHIAALLPELKVDVISVPDLAGLLSTKEGTDRVTTRFAGASTIKSTFNTLLLSGSTEKEGAGEVWQQKQINFAQFPELMRSFLQVAAGAADIPVTRLLGQSPSGLNSTGESDTRNYYDHVSSRQEVDLRPSLARLDEILIRSALGSRPDDIWYEWAPLWQLSETEKADVGLKKAQATKIYLDGALFDDAVFKPAVANQLVEDGIYPGLDQAIADAEADGKEIFSEPEPEPLPGGRQQADRPFADTGFDPNQPRDPKGRWTSSGIGATIAAAIRKSPEIKRADLGEVEDAGRVSALVGFDVSGFRHFLSSQAVAHIVRNHSTASEYARGQVPIGNEDFRRLPDLIRSAHHIVRATESGKNGQPRLEFAARNPDGSTTFYVAEVLQRKRRIESVTMWKKR